ncbi:hypothetical protein FRB96_008624 [Tulasnella sp. 330]|nr:hypothetical protein FRB96_008624 [Tulasnella sp. 330]
MTTNAPGVPSPAEAEHYYYGLPSKPALVARSSDTVWFEPKGAEAYLTAKELRTVGPHGLNGVWESAVASAIEEYLLAQQVDYRSVDPARIGYAGSESFPVILWVGVAPGSLSGTNGRNVALGCRAILIDNGITDVEVEIRVSVAALQAKLYQPVLTSSPIVRAVEPFATSLGVPICGGNTRSFEGTGGLFFTDSGRPGKLFLVTARHVLFHPDRTENKNYVLRPTGDAKKKVFLLGDAALKARINDIESEIGGTEIILTQLTARKAAVEGRDDAEARRERRHIQQEVEDAIEAREDLQTLLHDVKRDWPSDADADRSIGHIVVSPCLGFSVGSDRYTEDWAVVEIDASRIDESNFVGNCIDLGTKIAVDDFTTWMYPHPANPSSFTYPGNRLLQFYGTIPDAQMAKPDNKTLDHDNDPVIMVIKRGGASGLTVGRLNSIRSVVRYYFEGKPGQSTREVAVYPRNSKSGPFSEPGDSGSVVIDGKGRVAGILTGGAGATKLSDCTYVTSINFIVKRLQEHGYKPNIFPAADNL